jgi:serine/threonine protein kinase
VSTETPHAVKSTSKPDLRTFEAPLATLRPKDTLPLSIPGVLREELAADTTPVPPLAEPTAESLAIGAVAQPRASGDAPAKLPPRRAAFADFAPREDGVAPEFRKLRIGGIFAQGGMSILYDAVHTQSGRTCLLKVLKPEYRTPASVSVQAKLVAEGKLLFAAAPRIACLVPCRDYGVAEPVGAFLVMDKIEGRSLLEYLDAKHAERETFEPAVVAKLLVAILEGLHTMHALGAVHRDMKPANVLIPRDKSGASPVRIIDWGVAKTVYTAQTSAEARPMGTVAYMPPEQIRGDVPTARTDLYAVAMMGLEMMWRHPLIEEGVSPAVLLMRQHVMEPPIPPPFFVPPKLHAILAPCLAKDPDKRPPSALAVADSLRAWLREPDALAPRPKVLDLPHRPTFVRPGKLAPRARDQRPEIITTAPRPATRIAVGGLSDQISVVVRSGKSAGARFLLSQGRTHLGSHPGLAEIVLDDEGVSKLHAVLEIVVHEPDKPVVALRDLGSANGTSVEGVYLSRDEGDDGLELLYALHAGATFLLDTVELALMPAGRLGASGAWESYEEALRAEGVRISVLLA